MTVSTAKQIVVVTSNKNLIQTSPKDLSNENVLVKKTFMSLAKNLFKVASCMSPLVFYKSDTMSFFTKTIPNSLPENALKDIDSKINPIKTSKAREDLLLDGKAVTASYNMKVQERFVHVTHVNVDSEGHKHRYIIGVKETLRNRHGEWGAAVSVLDALPLQEQHNDILVSGDAGFCVHKFCQWLTANLFFYLFRIKQNSGSIFDEVLLWAELAKQTNPDGDYFEEARIAGGKIHSRRLWRLPGVKFSGYPGISEAVCVEKINLTTQHAELQYFITSFPCQNWISPQILERILLHWDTETGTFGTKDNVFHEDNVRYKSLQGAKSHVSLLNCVCNSFWAPVFDSYWLNQPMSYRIQFFKDHPEYNPLQKNGSD